MSHLTNRRNGQQYLSDDDVRNFTPRVSLNGILTSVLAEAEAAEKAGAAEGNAKVDDDFDPFEGMGTTSSTLQAKQQTKAVEKKEEKKKKQNKETRPKPSAKPPVAAYAKQTLAAHAKTTAKSKSQPVTETSPTRPEKTALRIQTQGLNSKDKQEITDSPVAATPSPPSSPVAAAAVAAPQHKAVAVPPPPLPPGGMVNARALRTIDGTGRYTSELVSFVGLQVPFATRSAYAVCIEGADGFQYGISPTDKKVPSSRHLPPVVPWGVSGKLDVWDGATDKTVRETVDVCNALVIQTTSGSVSGVLPAYLRLLINICASACIPTASGAWSVATRNSDDERDVSLASFLPVLLWCRWSDHPLSKEIDGVATLESYLMQRAIRTFFNYPWDVSEKDSLVSRSVVSHCARVASGSAKLTRNALLDIYLLFGEMERSKRLGFFEFLLSNGMISVLRGEIVAPTTGRWSAVHVIRTGAHSPSYPLVFPARDYRRACLQAAIRRMIKQKLTEDTQKKEEEQTAKAAAAKIPESRKRKITFKDDDDVVPIKARGLSCPTKETMAAQAVALKKKRAFEKSMREISMDDASVQQLRTPEDDAPDESPEDNGQNAKAPGPAAAAVSAQTEDEDTEDMDPPIVNPTPGSVVPSPSPVVSNAVAVGGEDDPMM